MISAVCHGAMNHCLFTRSGVRTKSDTVTAGRRLKICKAISQCIGGKPESCRSTDDVKSIHVNAKPSSEPAISKDVHFALCGPAAKIFFECCLVKCGN